MNTRALLRLSEYSRRPVPWRPRPEPEPFYDWDFSDMNSVLWDMYIWMEFHWYNEHALRSAIANGIYRYFEVVSYNRRRDILNESSGTVNKAANAVDTTLREERKFLKNLEKLERRRGLYRAGYTHQYYYNQKK
jgi:hypothetical protein